uniref:Uncharacterized protein n=1 Tax=Aegilops tauschii subsp. strangulata TaxID=200361 RepID=A0A453MPJ1_AEGTS
HHACFFTESWLVIRYLSIMEQLTLPVLFVVQRKIPSRSSFNVCLLFFLELHLVVAERHRGRNNFNVLFTFVPSLHSKALPISRLLFMLNVAPSEPHVTSSPLKNYSLISQ